MAGVEPVMVFSGLGNSLKAGKEYQHATEDHEGAIAQGKRLLECMRSTTDASCRQKIRHEAIACFQRGLRVTPTVEKNCIAALRRVGVMVIVAPYDADAQLASLCRSGVCQAVLTDDPNMLLYGAISDKPFPILYRFDSTGMVQLVSLSNIASSLSKRGSRASPQHPNKKKKSSTSTVSVSSISCGASSSMSSSATRPVNLLSLQKKDIKLGNEEVLTFLCQLLHTVHGRRQFIQMCLLLGNEYIEPLFEGISLTMAQYLIIKFSEIKSDLRFAAIKAYVDSSEGRAHFAGCSSARDSMTMAMSTVVPRSPKTSTTTYLKRLCRVEVMLFYHPIFDPKLKNIRNYSTPNYAPTSTTKKLDNDSYPAVNYMDIFRLGHGSHLLYGIPTEKLSVVNIATLCEGTYGMRDYQLIEPSLPWEHADIAEFSRQRVNHVTSQHNGSGGGGVYKGVWHNRSLLVRSLAAYIPSSSQPAPTATPSPSCSSSASSSVSGLARHRHNNNRNSSISNSNSSSGSSGSGSGHRLNTTGLTVTLPPASLSTQSSPGSSRVPNLLSPRVSTPAPPRPPPSSAIFQKEVERFHREYNRLVEAYHTAAVRTPHVATATSASVATVSGASMSASIRAVVGIDPCYKSPPTRKLDHVVKKTVTCSPSKGLIVEAGVESKGTCKSTSGPRDVTADRGSLPASDTSQENIIHNLMPTGIHSSASGYGRASTKAPVSVTADKEKDSSGMVVIVPVHTPPAPLSFSSAGAGANPLSPDLMRLASVATNTIHSPAQDRSHRHGHSHSLSLSDGESNGDGERSSVSSAKRKHQESMVSGGEHSDRMSGADCHSHSHSNKKKMVVKSISSYFKTAHSVI